MMNDVYISAGSNMGDRESYLEFALKELERLESFAIQSISPIYETAPIGYTEQPPFLNLALHGKTAYSPSELLRQVQEIEKKAQRVRDIRWGPRTLDLDILLYNQETIIMDNLVIPHPRMKERGFVIIPLYDIAPHLMLPPEQLPIEQLYRQFAHEAGIVKWSEGRLSVSKIVES